MMPQSFVGNRPLTLQSEPTRAVRDLYQPVVLPGFQILHCTYGLMACEGLTLTPFDCNCYGIVDCASNSIVTLSFRSTVLFTIAGVGNLLGVEGQTDMAVSGRGP